jgi:signal transduction histidine kinase
MCANQLWVKQILADLFSNANKFTERGVIQLRIRRTRSHTEEEVITFAMTDTGCGIPTEWMDWIFKPFEISKIYKDRTGLGLFTILTLCEMMGGKIHVTSQVGKGSTFTATLPAEGLVV